MILSLTEAFCDAFLDPGMTQNLLFCVMIVTSLGSVLNVITAVLAREYRRTGIARAIPGVAAVLALANFERAARTAFPRGPTYTDLEPWNPPVPTPEEIFLVWATFALMVLVIVAAMRAFVQLTAELVRRPVTHPLTPEETP